MTLAFFFNLPVETKSGFGSAPKASCLETAFEEELLCVAVPTALGGAAAGKCDGSGIQSSCEELMP